MSHIRRLLSNNPLAFLQNKLTNNELDIIKSNLINNFNPKVKCINTFDLDYKKYNTFYLKKIVDTNYGHTTNLIGSFRCNLENKVDIYTPPIYKTNYLLTNDFEQYKLDYDDLKHFILLLNNKQSTKSVIILPNEIHLVKKFALIW